MKEIGEAKVCLGLEITHDRPNQSLRLSQGLYAESVLQWFGMSSSKAVVALMEPRRRLVPPDDLSQKPSENFPYRSVIGSLMFLMMGTRPDIAYAVGRLAQNANSPTVEHWTAVKRVLRYVFLRNPKRRSNIWHEWGCSAKGYTHSDWAGCEATRKSTSGYVFMLGDTPISWRSKKQELTAASSCEAEYIAAFLAVKEAIWLKKLLADFHPATRDFPIALFIDNRGTHAIAYHTEVSDRTKHIEIKYYFTREAEMRKIMNLEYCPTEHMAADILTSPLDGVKFQKFAKIIDTS